jgi:hypothetical protein
MGDGVTEGVQLLDRHLQLGGALGYASFQLLVEPFELVLGLLAGSDVTDNGNHADNPVVVHDRGSADFTVLQGSLFCDQPINRSPDGFTLQDQADFPQGLFKRFRCHDFA